MRTAFIETLFELAQQDRNILLVVGDLGFGVVTPFMEKLPKQYLNVGVAEQNMTGMAAGMALSGKTVFTYSIGNFPILRCYEQIRNDVCYHKANVKIVSVGGGMAYGSLGPSHFAVEDLAVMRALPNMLVLAPGDPVETRLATRALTGYPGPAYLRLGRAGEPVVHQSMPDFKIGKAIRLRYGTDATLISTGGMLKNTMDAAELLARVGIQVQVLSMHTVKPLDCEAVLSAAYSTPAIFTVEEHSVTGGLGSAVAEVLAETGNRHAFFKRIGLNGEFSSIVGDPDYLCSYFRLNAEGIANTVETSLESLLLRKPEAQYVKTSI